VGIRMNLYTMSGLVVLAIEFERFGTDNLMDRERAEILFQQ
jgi:hypothetical protein